MRNFLTNLKILFFFEFFSENVLKTLLRGRETTRKKYRILFEKFVKYVFFFDISCPSITHHHPSPPPFGQTSWLSPGTPEGCSNLPLWGCLPHFFLLLFSFVFFFFYYFFLFFFFYFLFSLSLSLSPSLSLSFFLSFLLFSFLSCLGLGTERARLGVLKALAQNVQD